MVANRFIQARRSLRIKRYFYVYNSEDALYTVQLKGACSRKFDGPEIETCLIAIWKNMVW